MKTITLCLVYLVSAAFTRSFAQTTTTAAVALHVKGTLSITAVRGLSFGYVVQGTTEVDVDPITSGDRAALFVFTGASKSSFIVSFSSTDLTSEDNKITFAPRLAGSTESTQTQADSIASGNSVNTNSSGEYNFWAGGSAKLSPTQPFGVYSGTFFLTIIY